MDQQHPQIGKHRLLQGLRPNLGRLDAQLFVFLYRGADHKALVAFGGMLADEGIDAGTHILAHQEGVNRLTAGGELVQNRNIQVAIHDERQGAGNGCGRHDQHMGAAALGRQLGALGNTKAVLLVGNDQVQVVEYGGIG